MSIQVLNQQGLLSDEREAANEDRQKQVDELIYTTNISESVQEVVGYALVDFASRRGSKFHRSEFIVEGIVSHQTWSEFLDVELSDRSLFLKPKINELCFISQHVTPELCVEPVGVVLVELSLGEDSLINDGVLSKLLEV